MKSLFIDCSNGLSGDMFLAALIDLGVPLDVIKDPINKIGFNGAYSIKVEESKSCGLRGKKIFVKDTGNKSRFRNWIDIKNIVTSSNLERELIEKVVRVFEILAEAEAEVHGIDIDNVHFHEIGAIDSLVDIIGVCSAINYLKLDHCFCNFPSAGSGTVKTSHGKLPVPVPAVLELAKKYKIKLIFDKDATGELTTPTGLALMIGLAHPFGIPDSLIVESVGIGLGHRKFLDRPNLLRICLLNENINADFCNEALKWERIVFQESWIDDASPEDLSLLMDRLRSSGALEVTSKSIQMKKGRLGLCISAIVRPEDANRLRLIWLSFSTTIGLREREEGRWILPRRIGTFETIYGKILAKEVLRPDGKKSIKAESEELARICHEQGISLDEARKVVNLAMDTFKPSEDWNL